VENERFLGWTGWYLLLLLHRAQNGRHHTFASLIGNKVIRYDFILWMDGYASHKSTLHKGAHGFGNGRNGMHGEHSHISFSETFLINFYFYHGTYFHATLLLHDGLSIPKILQTSLAIFGERPPILVA
jgi:hypothetical protein